MATELAFGEGKGNWMVDSTLTVNANVPVPDERQRWFRHSLTVAPCGLRA
jgi:hypothetical protein